MNLQEIKFLESVFAFQQYGYAYYRDKYALQLVQRHLEQHSTEATASISSIKNSRFGHFLNKNAFKTLTAKAGNNTLSAKDLAYHAAGENMFFDLTLNKWGGLKNKHRKEHWRQTTRPGYNLVLQVNFSAEHDSEYYRLVKPTHDHPFAYHGHPICKNKTITMGWIRMDMDLETGELLIEEIQNDWLRDVKEVYERLCKIEKKDKKEVKDHWVFAYTDTSFEYIKAYYENILKPYYKIWDEALLSAALWFAWEELGINDIYYHTYEGGCKLKQCSPPRSIYTKLPRRFGFELTNEAPVFIQNCAYLKKQLKQVKPKWWRLKI